MAKFTVTAPAPGYTGMRAGVAFTNGTATGVDDQDEAQARALAYFRRRNYKVEREKQAPRSKPAGNEPGSAPAGQTAEQTGTEQTGGKDSTPAAVSSGDK